MSLTHTTPPFAPASEYPASPYLVAQHLPWSGTPRPAVIVVASDGTPRSDGAVRIALARAETARAAVEIVTVARWEPVLMPEGMFAWQEEFAGRRDDQRRAVEAQLERVTGRPRAHAVSALVGNPAHTISRVAIERHAALVVVGLGRRGLSDRLFGDETALQLARISRVPVLAVPEHATPAPWHAVVAVDFGSLSERAAQGAIDTVGDEGIVELVHVTPFVREHPFAVEAEEPCARWAHAQLDALAERLVVPPGVTLKHVVLSGRAAHDVLAYAKRAGANLIATGTHGRGFVARAVLGSVATSLLRGAECAVLAVPRDPLPALPARDPDRTRARPPATAWTDLLTDFTRRNAGRRTILEVDDLELGAQAQEYNYPLLGASYDARAERVELILGDGSADGRHLTRRIGGARAVDVLTDGEGHDVALRVQHGPSQTLLTFAR